MSGDKQQNGKWAPWWIYVPIILGSNYVKQSLVQDLPVAANAVITLVLVGTLFLIITVVYRSMRRVDR
ncbi:uncharacterized membrane protein YdcZ (DUF606 family) [Micromonospora jinlongensis]|uniref:Uncharacterized membrane protein YdcZ (DUF606 family) n=1 Tax=Micromonospora jinlongensis TaxID=1287877 RepID=A0A7Z0BB76_9ACTN|nr:hypothetical protein [Micromonospora jinlongensis]NYH40903.1 uncharacterized membrane protein YdcZ (DUF606 family) [Micromonospora jinlongensis]